MPDNVEDLGWLTYRVGMQFGGFNGSPNVDIIPPESMIHPTRNIDMSHGGREKRGGCAILGSTITGTPQILRHFQFRRLTATAQVLSHGNDGVIYKDYTTSIKTGRSTTQAGDFLYYRDNCYFVDGSTAPQTYDGTTMSNLGNLSADWSGVNFPGKLLKRGRGASERILAWRTPSNLDGLYYSNDETDNFSAGGKLRIDTGDGFGIIGVEEFGRQAVILGQKKAFIFLDEDTSPANWGYEPAQFEAGLANPHLLVRTPNDLVAMAADGEIYSVAAAQEYGDYRMASLTRPSFIHSWIQDNISLGRINQFHAIYDPSLRAILFFMVLSGEVIVRLALVYFVERDPREAWMPWSNLNFTTGFNASCSAIFLDTVGNPTVHTGDYQGRTWKLNQTTKSDNSNGYEMIVRTALLTLDNPRETKLFRAVRLTLNPLGAYDITMEWFVDGVSQGSKTLTVSTSSGAYGTATYGTSVYGGQEVSEMMTELGQVGKRIQFDFRNSVAGEDFFFSELLVDFEPLGARY